MPTIYKCNRCQQKITLYVKPTQPPTCAAPKHKFHPTTMEISQIPPLAG